MITFNQTLLWQRIREERGGYRKMREGEGKVRGSGREMERERETERESE